MCVFINSWYHSSQHSQILRDCPTVFAQSHCPVYRGSSPVHCALSAFICKLSCTIPKLPTQLVSEALMPLITIFRRFAVKLGDITTVLTAIFLLEALM